MPKRVAIEQQQPVTLLCWCCAVYGLTTPAVVADKRLCYGCLNSSPSACKTRHIAAALAVADA